MELAKRLEPLFKGFTMDPYRLTCGFPSRKAFGRVYALGECHDITTSKGGTYEIFINPLHDDSMDVAGTVAHEMAHVAAGTKAGHKGLFITVCKYVGLTKGKPTTAGPGPRLSAIIGRIIEKIGPYPHKAIVPRMVKVKPKTAVSLECEECGCLIRITNKWLSESGYPVCGCGGNTGMRE
jgi:hypothetical protein